jgi:imidazolonepropionase-like amidohydrolase
MISAAAALCGTRVETAMDSTQAVALVNGQLIDGTGAPPVAAAVLVFSHGRIQAVGPRDKVDMPSGAVTIDVNGGTILPGIVNAHVHQAHLTANLRAWAQAGVTTVRDMSGSQESFIAAKQALQDVDSARLVPASGIMTPPGGYGSVFVHSVRDAKQTVVKQLESGAKLIKIAIEDRLQGRKWNLLSSEVGAAIVATAHARGALVSAHVSRTAHVERALEIGVDDLAHMIVDPLSEPLAKKVVNKGLYWVPTLELWHCVSQLHQLPWIEQAQENLRRFVGVGGKVALGTDFSGYRCNFDHGMPTTEIKLMSEAGMTPHQIIMAATANAAHVCNLDNEVGTLEVGKSADTLVVRGDPLEDLTRLDDVVLVVNRGDVIRASDRGSRSEQPGSSRLPRA